METKIYHITRMGCDGCANSIQSALEKSGQVTSAKVSFKEATAEVTSSLSDKEIAEIVEKAGYGISKLNSE